MHDRALQIAATQEQQEHDYRTGNDNQSQGGQLENDSEIDVAQKVHDPSKTRATRSIYSSL